ncbi:MAG: cyclic nucleotide-binding domain-containing protein [Pseudomonadota bacterium]|nr:MAG: cyclic nucleotide-binding domain-containing protein [Pseudomonadota bacterium]
MSEQELLRSLIPLNSLSDSALRELMSKAVVEQLAAKSELFRQGDRDHDAIFLLRGEVSLTADDGARRRVVSGSDEARYALAQLKPRQYTGVAATEVTVLRVDSDLLDRMLTRDQTIGYEVMEFEGAVDPEWLRRMVQLPVFERLPVENINALLARLESIDAKAGQVIIRQGDSGDYYYAIKSGSVSVSRKSGAGKVVVLNELQEGEGFGEEALLSEEPRNATVVMKTDGVLLRLAPADFDELLKEPLVSWVTEPEARRLVQAGADLLDVRTEDEHRQGAVKGSRNLPLYLLRMKAATLDPARKYVAYCQTGRRSCAAAFLLAQRGFDVAVLRGGLDGVQKPSRA